MLIEKIGRDPKRNASLSLRSSVLDRVEAYRELYHQTYGEEIDRSELVEQLLVIALDRDKAFKRHEKEKARRKKDAPEKEAREAVSKSEEFGSSYGPSTPSYGQD